MFRKNNAPKKEKRLSLEEYIVAFTVRYAHEYDTKSKIVVENILFTLTRGFRGISIDIHLFDGDDELLVYSGDDNCSGKWLHKGVWCERIEQILYEDYEQKKRKDSRIKQAKISEENRLKDKFSELFSGYTNG